MGLFSKKDEYSKRAEQINETEETAADRIIFEQIENDDERAAKLVDEMKEGKPLVINLDNLEFIEKNKFLAFFAGACYALGGRTIKINEVTYLFARKEDYLDGSLKEFVENI